MTSVQKDNYLFETQNNCYMEGTKKNEEKNDVKGVNEINITISNTTENQKENVSISTKEQNDLKAYLSGIYNLEEKNININ